MDTNNNDGLDLELELGGGTLSHFLEKQKDILKNEGFFPVSDI